MANKKSEQKIKLIAQTYLESGQNASETYRKIYPHAKPATVRSNAWQITKDPKVQEEINRILETVKPIEITKKSIITHLGSVIARWYQDKESTANLIRVLELASKLVPDFASKTEIHSYQHMTEDELDKTIQEKYKTLLDRN